MKHLNNYEEKTKNGIKFNSTVFRLWFRTEAKHYLKYWGCEIKEVDYFDFFFNKLSNSDCFLILK